MNLIKTALSQQNIALPVNQLSDPALHREAHTELARKMDLITQLWENSEPITLLNIGSSVTQVQYDPIWKLALQAPTPRRLIEGWVRFEKYGHSNNRVQIKFTSENAMTCTRYALTPPNPSAMENHLICGILAALLNFNGCENLIGRSVGQTGVNRIIYKNQHFQPIVNKASFELSEWSFTWEKHLPTMREHTTSRTLNLPPSPDPHTDTARHVLRRASEIILSDITRVWKISDIAAALNLSQRSLQRRLKETGVPFSALIRLLRISEASDLLKNPEMSINAAGFCAGFSDNSHLSRDFRASTGMTPTEYQNACAVTS